MTPAQQPETLIWPLFVELMCAPLPPDRAVRGTIRTNERELWFASSWSAETGPPVVAAPLASTDGDGVMTAVVQDSRLRLDSPDGDPYLIVGRDTAWKFSPGDDRPDADEPSAFRYAGSLMDLLDRPSYDRFIGNDFAKADGPIEATTFLGRPAWKLTLKPPKSKAYPLHWIVDAETGTLLRQANEGFDIVAEWTSFEVVDALPDETFTWDGPTHTVEERAAEFAGREGAHAVEQARLLDEFGFHDTEFALTAKPTVNIHEHDDDGTFAASLSSPYGHLTRRRTSLSPDEEHVFHYRFHRTWRQGEWYWNLCFFDDFTLTDEQLSAFQAAFNASPDT